MSEYLQCPLCDWDVDVSEKDPDASLSEMFSHLRRDHSTGRSDAEMKELMTEVMQVNE